MVIFKQRDDEEKFWMLEKLEKFKRFQSLQSVEMKGFYLGQFSLIEGQICDFPERIVSRMNQVQIFNFVLSLKLENFESDKVFRRFVERKIESDTLEEEVRSKNMSLDNIEEERNLRNLRKRTRKHAKTVCETPNESL